MCPIRSPLTNEDVPPHYLHASSAFFRDTSGRAILLRGINLSGSSKAPVDRPTQRADGSLWQEAEDGGKSFTGRPLNLEDGSADVHLTRLKMLGFNCFRYVFTWEALEHQGPGKYDHEFMDYTVAVLRKCKEYGFLVYMDPHQDVFSRFTGGSGAPFWVLAACGIDHRSLAATTAAYLHSEWPSPKNPDPKTVPPMLWATNNCRLAPATLSVLFFASQDYAPLCRIDGLPLSEWLQSHFFAACKELAIKIRDAGDLFEECLIGWDSLNEPNNTYIGLNNIKVLPKTWQLRQGPMPTPIQSMRLGVGREETVDHYHFGSLGPKKDGNVVISPEGASIWLTPENDALLGGRKWGWKRDSTWPLGRCVWEAHGVWDSTTGDVLRPDYFQTYQGKRDVDFISDYWLPFWCRYKETVRSVHKESIMFVQPPVFEPPPAALARELDGRACLSPHFYDGLTLISKHWNWYNADAVGVFRGKYPTLALALRFGAKAVRKVMRDQIGYLRDDTLSILGQYPTLIGEIGIPFDLDKKKAYYGDSKGKGKGDYSAQTAALDASLNGCDGKNICSYTMWTYCPDHTHEWGDGWNGEDLSIWSQDNVDPDAIAASHLRGSSPTSSAPKSPCSRPSTSTRSSMDKSGDCTTLTSTSSSLRTTDPSGAVAQSLIALYSGLRSAGAVSRPYPMATIGTPLEIDFDMKSSLFKYVVEITKGDQTDAAGKPTEIFLPLIHYAADDELAQRCGRVEGYTSKGGAGSTSSSSSSSHKGMASPASPPLPSLEALFVDEVGIDCDSNDNNENAVSTIITSSNRDPRHLLSKSNLPPLALEIKVTSGSFQVSGQMLMWYPSSIGKQTIWIKRKGGAISPLEGGGGDKKTTTKAASWWCCVM